MDSNLKKNAISSYLLKTLKDHFQVLFLLMIIPLGIPSDLITVSSVFTTSTSPDLENTFSLDCLIKMANIQIKYTHFSLLVLFGFNMIAGLCFFLYEKKKL